MKAVIGIPFHDIKYDEILCDGQEFITFCPYCLETNDIEVQIDEYVEIPMIWCNCGAHCVLDVPKEFVYKNINDLEIIGNLYALKSHLPELNYNDINEENIHNYIFYYVNLLFIEKVVNHKLSKFESPIPLDQLTVIYFINNNYDNQLAQTLNITKTKDEPSFNLSLECNSYSSEHPLIPYPAKFDMYHGGPSIYLQCRTNTNEIIYTSYCGD